MGNCQESENISKYPKDFENDEKVSDKVIDELKQYMEGQDKIGAVGQSSIDKN